MREFYFFLLILFCAHCTNAQDASVNGEWSPPVSFGIVPVAVSNLPDGRLITWSSQFPDTFLEVGDGQTYTEIFDPSLGTHGTALGSTVTQTNHDMFCPGINILSDGSILSAGGTSSERTSIYNPVSEVWTRVDDMNIPRGYQGNVTTAEGWVFTLGGSWSQGSSINGGKDAELWTPETGWVLLPGIRGNDIYNANDLALEQQGLYRVDNHLWLWPASDGSLFHAGPSEDMHWIDINANEGNGTITSAGSRASDSYSMKGTTVMFDIDKILKVGGAESYGGNPNPAGAPGKNTTFVIDISGGYGSTASVSSAGSLAFGRTMHNSTVLPNGEVLVTGGLDHAEVFTDTGARLSAEIYNPTSNSWRTVAGMATPRTYHSVAILMTDGRVFVGGGGLCDSATYENCNNWTNAEIYSPPYLFDAGGALATRPSITAPDSADYNTTINVTGSTGIQEFSLIRFSAATHSTNNEQRRIPVSFSGTSGNYSVNIPDRNLLPPGYYMLFAMNGNGVPSIAETIQIGSAIPIVQDPNLVLDLSFDQNSGILVNDNSIYDNNGTVLEFDNAGNAVSSSVNWQTGLNNNAIAFDGLEFDSNSIIDVPFEEASLGTIRQSVTMSAWVYRDAESVISQTGKVSNVAIVAHEYPSLFFGYHNTLYKWAFLTSDGFVECYAGYDALDGWVHLAATYDGQTAKLYANGIEICSKSITGDMRLAFYPDRQDSFTISGFYNDGILDPFLPPYANSSGVIDELDGRLDDLKIYNRVLSQSELRNIYDSEVSEVGSTIVDCPVNGIIAAEYKIGSGPWQDVSNGLIDVVEGQEVFIRAKNYTDQYFVTTTEVDGPTFDSNIDLNAESAYQIDTGLAGSGGLSSVSDDGLVDQRNQGQYALSTADGCPTVVQLNVTPSCGSTVPSPWANQDVGAVQTLGVACELNGFFEIRASGADIWGSEDEFHYVYQEISGDVDIYARVISLEQTSVYAKAGIMIRNTLDADSRMALMAMSPGAGIGSDAYWLQHRNSDGEFMDGDNSTVAQADPFPSYMRLVRQGNTITGYTSDTPDNWNQVGNSLTIPMNQTIYVGLAVTSHNDGVISTATFDDVSIQGSLPTGNSAPVSMATGTPLSGTFPLEVAFDGSGSTDDDGITSYSWDFGDGSGLNATASPSHTYTDIGSYTATLTVTDSEGLSASSTLEVSVTDSGQSCTGSIIPEYRLNGTWSSGENDLTVEEGTQVMFSMLPNGIDVSLELPNGTVVGDDYLVGNVSPSDNGSYTLTSEQGCVTVINLTVTGDDDTPSSCVTLGAPWSNVDVGDVSANGSACYDGTDGSYEIEASGADIWGSEDEFHYVYQEISGDVDIYARVISLEQTSVYAKAGIMIRNTLDADSRMALMAMSPGAGIGSDAYWLQHRNSDGEFMDGDNSTVAQADPFPSYMRLVRQGNTITGYTSDTPDNWNQVGNSLTIPMNQTIYVGLAVTSHNDGVISTATFDDVSIQGSLPTGNSAPVSMATGTPLSGTFPLEVAFDGSGSTDDDGITSYSWDFGDGSGLNATASPSHTYTDIGSYTATLTVTDSEGLSASSTLEVSVTDSGQSCTGSIIPEYRLNGTWSSGENDLTVEEGTQVMFSMLPNGIDVSLELPNGTVVGDDYLVGNVTPSDNGSYTLTSEQGCVTVINLTVTGDDDTPSSCVTLGAPWSNVDVGDVSVNGSACYDGTDGSYEIEASGADIWGANDEFHYVYQTMDGDGEIVARVLSQDNTHGWAKAGIMMRNGLLSNSASALLSVHPNPLGSGAGYTLQQRDFDGSAMTSATAHNIGPVSATYPQYLRLVRQGDTFSAYGSATNGNWQLLGSRNIVMDQTIYVGLAVTSHNDGTLGKATFDNVIIGNAITALQSRLDDTTFLNLVSDKIIVFPNPTKGIISLSNLNASKKEVNVKVFASTGRFVSSKNYKNIVNDITMDLSNLSDGIYSIIIAINGVETSKAIIVKK